VARLDAYGCTWTASSSSSFSSQSAMLMLVPLVS
jgi:hypothetical protein